MSAESSKIEAKQGGIGHLVFGLALLCGALLLWWHWISALVWARGLDLPASLLVMAIVAFAATFCPPALFLLEYMLSRNRPRARWFDLVIGVAIVAGVLATICFIMMFELMMSWGMCVTNPKRYEEMLRTFSREETEHFPRAIPTSAKQVRFSYGPKVLQSSTHLQLRVKLPPEEVQATLAKFQSKALAVYPCARAEPDGVPLTRFYTGGTGRELRGYAEPFPDNYQILYLGPCSPKEIRQRRKSSENAHGSDITFFDPGATYGLAVDVSASEVIYWAESW